MRNPRITPKELQLIKGGLRRVFSRSELRRSALKRTEVKHTDKKRPRVTRWGWCEVCGEVTPQYLLQVDHINPVIPIKRTLETLPIEDLVDNIWCVKSNLQVLCKPCHYRKSGQERKERAAYKKSILKKNKLRKPSR